MELKIICLFVTINVLYKMERYQPKCTRFTWDFCCQLNLTTIWPLMQLHKIREIIVFSLQNCSRDLIELLILQGLLIFSLNELVIGWEMLANNNLIPYLDAKVWKILKVNWSQDVLGLRIIYHELKCIQRRPWLHFQVKWILMEIGINILKNCHWFLLCADYFEKDRLC